MQSPDFKTVTCEFISITKSSLPSPCKLNDSLYNKIVYNNTIDKASKHGIYMISVSKFDPSPSSVT
jgi:hypothetical protein